MARLVLGPMVRYVDEHHATVWVETDAPCTVEVLGTTTSTFAVHGHHYALVELADLPTGASLPYTVALDGEQVWPEPGDDAPPSRIRTVDPKARVRLLFGSCRTSVPHDPRYIISHGFDVLRCYARQLKDSAESEWPTTLLLLGDQVYADEPPEEVCEFIRGRRDTSEPPGAEIADFTEYAQLYRLAWVDPDIRWLLSTLPTAMIVDDHDLRDDWNTSQTWREQMAGLPWWQRRVVAGLGAYWVYQHLGNLPPAELAADPLLKALREADGDAGGLLDEFAARADADPGSNRWSYTRDLGGTRLVVLDNRCGRVLTPGARTVMDEAEWEWFRKLATGGGYDHLVIGASLPYLLPAGLHYLESWNEAVCDGVWGRRAARVGEKIRQGVDLEHWAAFRASFEAMAHLLGELSAGRHGPAPTSVGFLSGDVHYSYLACADLSGPTTVYQAVCSPIRNPLSAVVRLLNGAASFGVAGLLGRGLARLAKVRRTPFAWKVTRGPIFHNALGTLDLTGDRVEVAWESPSLSTEDPPPLQELVRERIT